MKTKGRKRNFISRRTGCIPRKSHDHRRGGVGTNAAKMAVGLGADVTMIDLNADRLRQLDDIFGHQIKTLMSNPVNIADSVAEADLLICAVLIREPKRRLSLRKKWLNK